MQRTLTMIQLIGALKLGMTLQRGIGNTANTIDQAAMQLKMLALFAGSTTDTVASGVTDAANTTNQTVVQPAVNFFCGIFSC